jgi:hypothetical protein
LQKEFGKERKEIEATEVMLLSNLTAGQSGIISQNKNPQLIVKGLKVGTFITIDKKTDNDFIIDLAGQKLRVTIAQSQQISVY